MTAKKSSRLSDLYVRGFQALEKTGALRDAPDVEYVDPVQSPNRWMRGKAVLDGEMIRMVDPEPELYRPLGEGPQLAFDLAAVNEPREALAFVRKYGLLWHGPGFAQGESDGMVETPLGGAVSFRRQALYAHDPILDAEDAGEAFGDDAREPEASAPAEAWGAWEALISELRVAIDIYLLLQRWKEDEPGIMVEAREVWGRWVIVPGRPERLAEVEDDYEFVRLLGRIGTGIMAYGLRHAYIGVGTMADFVIGDPPRPAGSPADYLTVYRAQTLEGHVFNNLLRMMQLALPARRCAECRRTFIVFDARQVYCDKRCSDRARHRRYAEKKRGATS